MKDRLVLVADADIRAFFGCDAGKTGGTGHQADSLLCRSACGAGFRHGEKRSRVNRFT